MRYLIILFFLINVTAMAQKKQIQEIEKGNGKKRKLGILVRNAFQYNAGSGGVGNFP